VLIMEMEYLVRFLNAIASAICVMASENLEIDFDRGWTRFGKKRSDNSLKCLEGECNENFFLAKVPLLKLTPFSEVNRCLKWKF